MTEDRADFPAGLVLAWEPAPMPRRGPRPTHSVTKIVAVAVEMADERGLEAVSLHNVAAHIGVTTNALYNYIGSKEELLALALNAAMDGPPDDLPRDEGWRRYASAWTTALMSRFRRHPWLLDLPIRGAPVTPGPMRWLELILRGFDDTGLTDQEQLACVMLLEGHARNAAQLQRDMMAVSASPQLRLTPGAAEFLFGHVQAAGLSRVASVMTTGAYAGGDGSLDDGGNFGLDRILDGIAQFIDSADAPPSDLGTQGSKRRGPRGSRSE